MNFWIVTLTLLAIALAFIVPPLLKKPAVGEEPSTPGGMRRWLLIALLALIPLVSVAFYYQFVARDTLATQQLQKAHSTHDVEGMLKGLETKTKQNPDDAELWLTLGDAYITLGRYSDAEKAHAKASQLQPKEARYLSHYAEAIGLVSGTLEGEPAKLLTAALEIDPEDEKALELSGLAAYKRNEFAQAVHYWKRLLKRIPKESEFHQEISSILKDAQMRAEAASGLGEKARLSPPEGKQKPHP